MAEESAPSRKVTINDVAKAASVSRSSVSNYINQRFAHMSAETKERITGAIEALGYRPSSAARQLKTGRASMIGLLVPTVINPFFGELALAIEQAASGFNYRVLLCNTMRNLDRESEFEEEMISHGIRGIISVSPITDRHGSRRGDLSVVAIDAKRSSLEGSNFDLVNIDNMAATALAVTHLVENGHRNIAYVTDPPFTFSRAHRVEGFKRAIKDHQLSDCEIIGENTVPDDAAFSDVELFELGRQSVAAVMASEPRPTAVIALNDMIAIGMMSQFRAQGLRLPEDISVVGIDDIVLARLTSPALTTVRQPIKEMAETAVAKLVARMNGLSRFSTETVFQPELVIRGSTAAPLSLDVS